MSRFLLVVCLAAVASGAWSCAKTYSYQSYEVIRAFDQVKPGEDIKVVLKDGELVQGTIVQVVGDVLTVATFDKGRKKVRWADVRVAETVKKTVVTVP